MSNYNVNYRHNPIEPPEPEQNPQNDSDKLEAGDIKAASPALRWLDNFWYHHKWKVIIISFFVVVFAVGIFQMEGEFAHSLLRQFEPHNIFDMSLVTACIRPSGGSYRNDLIQKKIHKNPSAIIDELLKDNFGYLVYQEDI